MEFYIKTILLYLLIIYICICISINENIFVLNLNLQNASIKNKIKNINNQFKKQSEKQQEIYLEEQNKFYLSKKNKQEHYNNRYKSLKQYIKSEQSNYSKNMLSEIENVNKKIDSFSNYLNDIKK